MRHLDYLPRYQQQMVSLDVMKIHAILAHAVGANYLSLELEDLSFQYLFPYSYLYVSTWLRTHETGSKPLIDVYKEQLLQFKVAIKAVIVPMKKLLRDGRKPEEVNDILGLRVILKPSSDLISLEERERACYRARTIIQSLWTEIPSRSKDYIARPKANGYKSLTWQLMSVMMAGLDR